MARRFRIVHVECATPEGWRWLKRSVRGAVQEQDGRFRVTDESDWAQCLAAAGGREID
jgi:hypothetical protein